MSKVKIDYLDNIKKDIKKYAHEVSSNLAHIVTNKLETEYNDVISKFYSERQPLYYHRHDFSQYLGEERPGLGRTYRRYYKNSHNSIYYGGIEIEINHMFTDYGGPYRQDNPRNHDVRNAVLDSFLDGYHGPEFLNIKSGIDPYNHMSKYRDNLEKNIHYYIPDAVAQAQKSDYSVLKF